MRRRILGATRSTLLARLEANSEVPGGAKNSGAHFLAPIKNPEEIPRVRSEIVQGRNEIDCGRLEIVRVRSEIAQGR